MINSKEKRSAFKLIDFLICLLIPLQICTGINNGKITPNIIYIIFLCIISISVFNNYKHIITIPKKISILFFSIILGMFIIPFLNFHITTLGSFLYSILLIVFLFTCNAIASRLKFNLKTIIIIWTILSTLIIDFMIVSNIREINSNTIKGILYVSGVRYRASFGFSHPNFTAIFIDTLLLLYYISIKQIKTKKIKILIILFIVFNFIGLLCTGSRTAVISLFIFLVFERYFSFFR